MPSKKTQILFVLVLYRGKSLLMDASMPSDTKLAGQRKATLINMDVRRAFTAFIHVSLVTAWSGSSRLLVCLYFGKKHNQINLLENTASRYKENYKGQERHL